MTSDDGVICPNQDWVHKSECPKAGGNLLDSWLTLRYGLQAQLAVRRADAEAAAATALRTEKEKRYLAILQNVESLYANNPNPAGRAELLKNVREVWLLGDEELVRKCHL
jgi:hypothetical protein